MSPTSSRWDRSPAIRATDPWVEIPIQWALDDWEQFFLPDISGSGLIETPRKAREL